ncbi:aminomethyl-transferring glycine dehydrogenase subunit GcvPA [Sporosarcina saromensis]|uniref:Aminomethyl-transferring glycine dehydrogenase subunit GcvPA n=1 Tax=Sporosarcina saromensis TaxID=359365 RepID=A0ABU4G7X6_9BACL|nr:aminomethyl-transferring glycine dehydrogenase subunit GcvPA [Sporosarcina saromensis]MDW0113079.1 aminomethyl-transferring glycine dehydrogenase subunit GcvPA [Sporosarcina saromensis]
MTKFAHPYIPNTEPKIKEQMLKEIGVDSVEDLFDSIPDDLLFKGKLNIPEGLSELELRKKVIGTITNNTSTQDVISFLGGGCWEHYIPAVCDEINSRAEFLTAYAGDEFEDHGRYQALFEYQSLMGALLEMDVVNIPTFDWAQAIATSIRMAARKTGRSIALVSETISPERLQVVKNYCSPAITIELVEYDKVTGRMRIDHLQSKLNDAVAAVYFENPSYLGFIETEGKTITSLARSVGAESIVGVDPISLGILETPSKYGADIICGELQSLGIHMSFGGGLSGFISTRDEIEYVQEFPSRLFGIAPTIEKGEYGFGDILYDRTSFAKREKGKESVGTQTSMWALTAGVYLALMGPHGMAEVGELIMHNSRYAIEKLKEVKGVNPSKFGSLNFKEFVVDFNATGKTVEEISRALKDKGIFGGIDLSKEFEGFGECALFCVTEIHSKEDIDTLVTALKEIVE